MFRIKSQVPITCHQLFTLKKRLSINNNMYLKKHPPSDAVGYTSTGKTPKTKQSYQNIVSPPALTNTKPNIR